VVAVATPVATVSSLTSRYLVSFFLGELMGLCMITDSLMACAQQWQQGNPDDAATVAQQQSRQRRGRGGRNRPDRDGDRQEQPQKDQKDQLTWQQKMLLEFSSKEGGAEEKEQ
jgi:hypothetical protein